MNVEELRTVQRTERRKDSLQHLRDPFYRDVADYLAERKAERERVAAEAEDPFSSSDVGRLTDEIETAEKVVESIYERRIGKIVKRATFAAAGMATEDEGLTSEERELFEDLVARIEANRETVLDGVVAGTDADAANPTDEADPASGGDPTGTPTTDDTTSTPTSDDLLATAMGGSDDGPDGTGDATATDGAGVSHATNARDRSPTADVPSGSSTVEPEDPASGSGGDEDVSEAVRDDDLAGDPPRTTLRITRDVGEILGVDERAYDLTSGDVVTLPTPNAEPLLDRDAAERLD